MTRLYMWAVIGFLSLFLAPSIKHRTGRSTAGAWLYACGLLYGTGTVIALIALPETFASRSIQVCIGFIFGGFVLLAWLKIYGDPKADHSWALIFSVGGVIMAVLGYTSGPSYPLDDQYATDWETAAEYEEGRNELATLMADPCYEEAHYKIPEENRRCGKAASPRSATPTPTTAYTVGCVITDTLNIRMGPGTFYKVVTGLKRGTCVDILEYMDSEWVRVKNGYMSIKFLEITGGSVP